MKSYRADFILLFVTLIWASTFAIVKDLLGVITPFLFIVLRFGLAAIIFIIIFNKKINIRQGKTFQYGLILGTLHAIGFCLQTVGLQYTTASKSAFITGTLVVWAPVFQIVTERKLINIWQFAGVIFAGIGLYILSSPDTGSLNIGDILTLIGAVLFGIYVVYVGKFSKVSDIKGLVVIQFILTVLIALPFAVFYETFTISYSGNIYLTILYMSIFATIVCSYLQTKFQKETTPTRAGIIYTFEPLFAALIAFIIFHEVIGTNIIIGGILILFGLLFSELSDLFLKLTFKREKNI
jgi:drug/metabolite transporter (DMT)-like permease